MKISFENLGAIKKVELDLSKKLILLCGPNGTGKTYVSYAVYGYFDNLLIADVFKITDLVSKKKITIDLNYTKLLKLKKEYFADLNSKIGNVFGLSLGKDQYFSNFKSKSLLTTENFEEQLHNIAFSHEFMNFSRTVSYTKKAESDVLEISLKGNLDINDSHIIELIQNAWIGKYLCNLSMMQAYILPVERNSVYTFAGDLAVGGLKSKDEKLIEERKYAYPKPIEDALETAITLAKVKKEVSEYASLADDIEQDILRGRISISDDGELLFSPKDSDNVNLPIHLSASIIKNLSGLVVYLRHQAKENDLLIIDEPELGLHPDNQVRLARIFARLINAGLRLMISTHSDYIIREINNLIMLSSDKKAVKDVAVELGYRPDESIKTSDLSCYLFDIDKDNASQVSVTSLPISDNGFEIKSIDDAICSLNERTDDIFYALQYGDKGEEL